MNPVSHSSSCLGCKKRHVGCHDGCPNYLAFREQVDAEREAERQAKTLYDYGKSLVKKKPRRKW